MELPTIIELLFRLMVVLCAAAVVYGGWLCWGESEWSDENDRCFGPLPAPPRQLRADVFRAVWKAVVQQPMFNLSRKAKFLCCGLTLGGISFVMFAAASIALTGSPESSAAATVGTCWTDAGTPVAGEGAATLSGASLDYRPANYVNQGWDDDGNVIAYEHDGPTDIAPTGSPETSAAATVGTGWTDAGTPVLGEGAATLSGASLDYFPANYLNQGWDYDDNVMT